MASKRHLIGAALGAALAAAAPAVAAPRVAVRVVPPFPPARFAGAGAVGLLVPGSGSTVTRAGALAALVRGRVQTSLLGGVPRGATKIRLARAPGKVTIYVSLPPPGARHNVVRYPVAIVGGGYHGLLESSATRIPGLVSVADVAPTALALEAGTTPRITSTPAADAPSDLRRLDARLAAAHDARVPARLATIVLLLVAFAGGLLLRSRTAARAGLLVAPAALSAALVLSAAHEYRPRAVVAAIVAACVVGLGVARLGERAAAGVAAPFLAAELAALALWPTVNALAPLGPHPDGGGRYYGITNEVETLLLTPALYAGAVLGGAALPAVAAVALVLVGWSRAGADGGGLLVFAVAFGVLWLRLRAGRLDPRRLALAVGAAVAAGLLLVGLDAATGGSSHVTHALAGGPGSLASDEWHRLRVSWAGATSSWPVVVQTLGSLVGLVVLAAWGPRTPAVDALLVGLAVSFLVNDTPQDVAAFGALGCGVLWASARAARKARPWAREVAAATPRPRRSG